MLLSVAELKTVIRFIKFKHQAGIGRIAFNFLSFMHCYKSLPIKNVKNNTFFHQKKGLEICKEHVVSIKSSINNKRTGCTVEEKNKRFLAVGPVSTVYQRKKDK